MAFVQSQKWPALIFQTCKDILAGDKLKIAFVKVSEESVRQQQRARVARTENHQESVAQSSRRARRARSASRSDVRSDDCSLGGVPSPIGGSLALESDKNIQEE